MDITLNLLPDPLYYPLPPCVNDVLTYAWELEEESNNISFKWAEQEIKNHLLSYVKVGLVAQKVRLYRLWRHAQENYKSFKEYCEKGLGKSYWSIKKIIEAARITLELAQAGFTSDYLSPLWAWLGNRERNLKKRSTYYERLYSQSVAPRYGVEISSFTQKTANLLCDIHLWEQEIETELHQLLLRPEFKAYNRVFTQFGIGLRPRALLLSQIYPIY